MGFCKKIFVIGICLFSKLDILIFYSFQGYDWYES